MKCIKKTWLIITASCLTVMEASYQIFLQFSIPLKLIYDCEYVGESVLDGLAHFQFRYGLRCAFLNKTIMDFIKPHQLDQASESVKTLVDIIYRATATKGSDFANVFFLVEYMWIINNALHILSSFFLFSDCITTKGHFYGTILPWIILTFLIAFQDISATLWFLNLYLVCRAPSKCRLWYDYSRSKANKDSTFKRMQKLDELSVPGSELYDINNYMPLRMFIVACKHIGIVPLLVVIACVLIRERRRSRKVSIKQEHKYVVIQ